MSAGPLETVYDEEIAPLLDRIATICRAHGMAFHAGTALDGRMTVMTHQQDPDNVAAANREAYELWCENYTDVILRQMTDPGERSVRDLSQGDG